MEIFGIGTDIIEVDRIKNAIEKHPGFLKRIFTLNEIQYCESKKENKYQSFASRFAAKEAVAKSLRQGLGEYIFFNEIEILNDNNGSPYVSLYGRSNFYFLMNNIEEIKITLSSTKNYSIAYAISFKK
ncbi:MAG: holo-ACP synthase [Actinobacteria bacterium]|nr:holo-ACP synthase [Actinomycetota bacterium]